MSHSNLLLVLFAAVAGLFLCAIVNTLEAIHTRYVLAELKTTEEEAPAE